MSVSQRDQTTRVQFDNEQIVLHQRVLSGEDNRGIYDGQLKISAIPHWFALL